ncbi:MAG: calcium-binding protein, partial [Candidatus Saccharimonadales bacterium]
MILNAPKKGSADAIHISGGAVQLVAPTSGPYQGIAIFQDRNADAPLAVDGQGSLSVTGVIYAAGAPMNIAGGGQVHLSGNSAAGASARVVTDDLSVSGNGALTIDASQNAAWTGAASTASRASGNSLFAASGQPLLNVPLASLPGSSGVTYSATIDWGDGSGATAGAVALATGQLTIAGTHVFTGSGSYQIQIVVTGSDGSTASVAATAVVGDVVPEPDPTNAGATELAIGGTTASDTINVSAGTTAGTVMVTISNAANGTITEGPFSPTGRIVIYGQAGNDVVDIANNVMLPGWVFTGNGNNNVTAGGGPSVLVGGVGNDTLTAGSGRDILIGGQGADSLVGSGGDDLMIAGTTAYDANDIALAAILAEWDSADSLAVRMA